MFIISGYSVEVRVQAPSDRSPDKTYPEVDKVPHAPGGNPQALRQGQPQPGGQGPGDGLPGHDRRPKPGQ